jgi:hypothetical protein
VKTGVYIGWELLGQVTDGDPGCRLLRDNGGSAVIGDGHHRYTVRFSDANAPYRWVLERRQLLGTENQSYTYVDVDAFRTYREAVSAGKRHAAQGPTEVK